MKFRMLILAAALMAFASISFGQNAVFSFAYHNAAGGSIDWVPLYYDCLAPADPILNPVLQDGCVVRLMRDMTPTNRYHYTMGTYWYGYEAEDPGYAVGTNYANYEIMPSNEFVFNSATITGASTGGFLSTPNFYTVGGVAPVYPLGPTGTTSAARNYPLNTVGQKMYLAIGCYDDQGVFNCMYYSAGYIELAPGPTEVLCNNDIAYESYFWVCTESPCPPPVTVIPCEQTMTGSPFVIDEGTQQHGDIDDPNPDQFFCVNLCEGSDLTLQINHLKIDEVPIVNVLPGCAHNEVGCSDPCDPALFTFDVNGWDFIPDPLGSIYGTYVNTIIVTGDGCACIRLEDILPVEMGSIAITPRDASVELTWNTLAESGLDYFKVIRNDEVRATINATAEEGLGANYSYTDEARNGVTYSYSIVAVEVGGNETVLLADEATPNANLAVITEYALHQNYPNPFNPTTSIVFDVVESNHVTLTIYNAMGQEVTTLLNGTFNNGRHSVEFSSDNLTSGLYFYSIKIGNEFTATKKMLLVK